MQLITSILAIGGLATSVAARNPAKSVGKKFDLPRPQLARSSHHIKRQSTVNETAPIITAPGAQKFVVNGTAGAIPQVNFDIGESYAGLLPISDKTNETSELYFWFFPSSNPDAGDEITIWLNGGPGCSSLEGFLQENGPISWQYGSGPGPVYNPWNWANLTNMIWVEQPVGTGFTQGTPTATSQEESAAQFLGFWKNFMDTFGLKGKKVYIAGESYAGRYVPYITDAMLNENDTDYFNVKAAMIYDPSIAEDTLLEDIPSVPFVDRWAGLFNLNETFTKDIHRRAHKCGYTQYIEKHLTFPPKGKFPTPKKNASDPECSLWNDIINAVMLTNPCFDVYAVATTCPLLWDVLGFPGSFDYLPPGVDTVYFNMTDVQKAINAPIMEWAECNNGVLDTDTSPQSSWEVIPRITDQLDRFVIVHGELDFILLYNGSLMAIQNMTWGGMQGFQKEPKDPFFVPYHDDFSLTSLSASGVMGTTHTERKLTWVQQALSGHMVPQYQPSSAYRQLEFLLGRIPSLTSEEPFTTLRGNSTKKRDLGIMGNY